MIKTKFYTILASLAILACGCNSPTQQKQQEMESNTQAEKNYETISTVRLTVSESKRLIAKGLAKNKDIQDRLKNGMIIITLGTTNTYIAEELAGLDSPRGSFVTGRIFPSSKEDFAKDLKRHPEIVLIKGKVTDISYMDALSQMQPEDIVLKGANMLNYAKRQAAVCVGAPDGGTVARLRKYTDKGKGRWIVPIGLEKETTQDLFEMQSMVNNSKKRDKTTVRLNATEGNVYTEIEAIKEFANIDVFVTAKGGIDGAEGGVSLLLCGAVAEVNKAKDVISGILGEPAFTKKLK